MRPALCCTVLLSLTALAACQSPPAPPPAPAETVAPASPSSAAPGSPTTSGAPAAPATLGTPTDSVTGLTSPWGLAEHDGTVFVTERDTGRILRVDGDRTVELARVADVDPSSEGGLLGLAINEAGDALFVYYSTPNDNRIARYPFDGEQITGEPQIILDGIPVAAIHNGGQLAFGPDGNLYASTGDATERGSAQDSNSLSGKILRLTEDGEPAADNPFGNAVFSIGHRNVQGLAFDDNGRLFASEFGQNDFDEVNLIERGGNYGWPEVEGDGDGGGRFIRPLAVWTPAEASPSGLAYADGSLWMAGLRGARLWQIPLSGDGIGEPTAHLEGSYGRLRSVLATSDGLLVGTSNTDGRGTPRDGDDRLLAIPLS